ncbi:MAG: sigma-70 family RNA polymerase sigma factor [Phycisphaerae bacterium]|nr:sigma-70 family RNA polymerase sigma factor [Phycisphaerae bacterium]
MPDADHQIVEACQRGEPGAFEGLVRLHGPSVLGYLNRVCGDPEQAEDCFQETFARAYRNLHRAQPATFRAWLFRIATNSAIDGFRRRNRVKMTSLDQRLDEDSPGAAGRAIEDSLPGPAEAAAAQERVAAVQRAVTALPEGQRAALVLAYYQQMSYGEVAEVLGCSIGTVKTHMSRALATLAKTLPDVE